MNAHIRRTFYLFAMGFVVIVGMLAYWQVYKRETLANSPKNGLQTQRAIETPRGLILARDGETVLAKSEKRGQDEYERVYPEGDVFANVVGYWSVKYGATGIEIGENSNLSATTEPDTLDELMNQMSGGPQAGNNITTTLDPQLQQQAYDLISRSNTGRGSTVAMNPQTGEVLSMVSYPSFDPNNIDENFQDIAQSPDDPLLDRTTQGLYAPGSVQKVVTAAAALEEGVAPSEKFFDSGSYQAEAGGYRIINFKGFDYGEVTFTEALAKSINTIFAEIAVERVGTDPLIEMAERFGWGDSYEDFPLPIAPSSIGSTSDWDKNDLAAAGFGQGSVLTNTFQMAQVTSAIANDGTMMEPHLIREVRSPDGVILERPGPETRRRVLDPGTAEQLTRMMEQVVSLGGTSPQAEIQGVEVAAKTGTAETTGGQPHSWFIAFAPADDPKIAVATLIENGGEGNKQALPVAKQMIESYLKKR